MEHELIEMVRRETDALQRTANPPGKLHADLVAEAKALLRELSSKPMRNK